MINSMFCRITRSQVLRGKLKLSKKPGILPLTVMVLTALAT